MKLTRAQAGICLIAVLIMSSCSKQEINPTGNIPGVARKVQFTLYTDQDFSNYPKHITFTLSIRNSANKILWDSILPAMLVKDIPDLAHKLVIEKTVPDNDPSQLKLAFDYYLENVGYSWYTDIFKENETLKVFTYNFQ
jgi:aspartyl/asparaginyl beta-hydroxylase (cupin superfamily)